MKFKYIYPILILIFAAFSVSAQTSYDLVLGNPSKAKTEAKEENNYLVNHTSFALSYNKERGAANWVMWHLEKSDIGKVDRSEAFAPDIFLPQGWWVLPKDYSGSGYDRGHMCPSKDRSDSDARNIETFLMSNMQPQAEKLNRQTWRYLEDYTREIVGSDNEAYVFAGCYGDKGKIKEKITIPTNCFKIIVLLPMGEDDLKRVGSETRVIAVDMPNDESVSQRWRTYLTTVDEIEDKTGYDFLSSVPQNAQKAIESKVDALSKDSKTDSDTTEGKTTETKKTEKTDKSNTKSEESAKKSEKTSKDGRTYVLGSKGGCYYLNDSGNKVYVKDKSLCENQTSTSTVDKKTDKSDSKSDNEEKTETDKSDSSKTDTKTTITPKKSRDGKTYMLGPKGGCYYLNDSGKKVYVKDKSLCEQ